MIKKNNNNSGIYSYSRIHNINNIVQIIFLTHTVFYTMLKFYKK